MLQLDSRPEEVNRLLEWLEPGLLNAGLDEMSAFSLRCAVVEIVNNSIEHAYNGEPGHPLQLRLIDSSDELSIEVRDQGPEFHPPEAGEASDPMALSGRGFEIVRAWVDALDFERDEGWNVWRMTRRKSM